MVLKLLSKTLFCSLAVVLLSSPAIAKKQPKKTRSQEILELPAFTAPLLGDPMNNGMEYSYEIDNDVHIIHYRYPGICDRMFENIYSDEDQKKALDSIGNIKLENESFLIPYPIANPQANPPKRSAIAANEILVYFIGGLHRASPNLEIKNCFLSMAFTSEDQMLDARMYFTEKVFDSPAEQEKLEYEKEKKLSSDQRLARALASLIHALHKRLHPELYPKPEPKKQVIEPTVKDTIPNTTQN